MKPIGTTGTLPALVWVAWVPATVPCKLCGANMANEIFWITNYGQTCNQCAPMGDLKGAAK
jgi:hypothetical protein